MMLVARRCEPPINWTLFNKDEPHLFEWTSAVTDDFCCRFPNRETTFRREAPSPIASDFLRVGNRFGRALIGV
jgi:hypothetical protein